MHVSTVDLLGQEPSALRTQDSWEVRVQGAHTVAGSDPRSPKGFWRDSNAKKGGRSRPQNVFSRVRIAGGVHGLVREFSSACLVLMMEPSAEPFVE